MFLKLSENKSELKKYSVRSDVKFHFAFEDALNFTAPKYFTYEFDGRIYDLLREKKQNNEYIKIRFERKKYNIKIEKITRSHLKNQYCLTY